MTSLPKCPKCNSKLTYEDGQMFVCPECGHEWTANVESEDIPSSIEVRDAHGNILENGDTITLVKDLKLKGTSSTLKAGTKVKNIRLVEVGDHNLDCKIDGIGALQLKSEFVKKVI